MTRLTVDHGTCSMVPQKKSKQSIKINYQTQWKHHYLNEKNYLYFEPNTLIEDIVPLLENRINEFYPDLNANYKKSITGFSRLYRNLISHYKGWQILYREPGSNENYGSINQLIGYKKRNPKQFLKRSLLKNSMLWTHDLYPLVEKVEIKGVNSCEALAQRLNAKIEKPGYYDFLNNLAPLVKSLSDNYRILLSKSANFDEFDCNNDKNNSCSLFCKNVETIYKNSEKLTLLMTKDYTLYGFNVGDVLQQKNGSRSSKGWRVEFLN